jgi:hypothetical protein
MTKRKQDRREDELEDPAEDEVEDPVEAEDEAEEGRPVEDPAPTKRSLSEWTEGFPKGKNIALWIYRRPSSGKLLYLAKVLPPISPEYLKENFGGGDYEIYAYEKDEATGATRLCGRSQESIGGDPKATTVPSNVPAILPHGQGGISDFVELYRTIKSMESDKPSQGAEMIQVMGAVQQTMTQMNMMQMTMMKTFTEMVQGMNKDSKEPGIPSLISQGLEKVSNLVMGILIAKNPAVASIYNKGGTEPDDLDDDFDDAVQVEGTAEVVAEGQTAKAPEVDMNAVFLKMLFLSLEKGQRLKDQDYDFYYQTIRKVPGLVPQLVALDFGTVLAGMVNNGLKVTDEAWLKGLFEYMKAKTKGRTKAPEAKKNGKEAENEGKNTPIP